MSIYKSRFVHYVNGKIYAALADRLYDYRGGIEGHENIETAREILREGQIIAYFNHICLDDGALILTFLLDNFSREISLIGGPESMKHFDFRRNPVHALLMRTLVPLAGLKMVPVVQHYDRERYSEKLAGKTVTRFQRVSRQILDSPGGMYLIAPEGTRCEEGREAEHLSLQRAQKGAYIALKRYRSENTYVLPIGIIPRDGICHELNLFKRFTLRAGKPIPGEDILNEDLSRFKFNGKPKSNPGDVLMTLLAGYLPEKMRGVYEPYVPLT